MPSSLQIIELEGLDHINQIVLFLATLALLPAPYRSVAFPRAEILDRVYCPNEKIFLLYPMK